MEQITLNGSGMCEYCGLPECSGCDAVIQEEVDAWSAYNLAEQYAVEAVVSQFTIPPKAYNAAYGLASATIHEALEAGCTLFEAKQDATWELRGQYEEAEHVA